jgi:transcriptional regulator with XRE-family HTH domain
VETLVGEFVADDAGFFQQASYRLRAQDSTLRYYHFTVMTPGAGPAERASAPSDRGLSLSDLRRRLGRSQAEVASAMGTTQSGVSRIERQRDIRVSTLDEYLAALGAELHLIVQHGTGRAEIAVPSLRSGEGNGDRREYRVIWQDQTTRGLVHVGWLEFTGENFSFSYTEDAKNSPRFKPFPPFPVFDETYRSADLFPFFAVRLITTADPAFDAVIDALGLTRDQATPVELLSLSAAESPHDTIQVIPEPIEQPDGTLVRTFLVSGIRHVDEERQGWVSEAIAALEPGTPLDLVADPGNPKNPAALQVAAQGRVIGWVPDYLVDEVRSYLGAKREMSLVVERANGADVPWHLRLLCRLTVSLPSGER